MCFSSKFSSRCALAETSVTEAAHTEDTPKSKCYGCFDEGGNTLAQCLDKTQKGQ